IGGAGGGGGGTSSNRITTVARSLSASSSLKSWLAVSVFSPSGASFVSHAKTRSTDAPAASPSTSDVPMTWSAPSRSVIVTKSSTSTPPRFNSVTRISTTPPRVAASGASIAVSARSTGGGGGGGSSVAAETTFVGALDPPSPTARTRYSNAVAAGKPSSAYVVTFAATVAISANAPPVAGRRSITKPVSFTDRSCHESSIRDSETAVAVSPRGIAGTVVFTFST